MGAHLLGGAPCRSRLPRNLVETVGVRFIPRAPVLGFVRHGASRVFPREFGAGGAPWPKEDPVGALFHDDAVANAEARERRRGDSDAARDLSFMA